MDDVRNFITTGEAARRLGVVRTQVIYLFDTGRLSGLVTAVGRLIDPDSVEAYRQRREQRKAARRTDQELRAAK